jgi:hypothetical protein
VTQEWSDRADRDLAMVADVFEVWRHTDVASSLTTSERCFSALAHRGFLAGEAGDHLADCFARAQ